MGRSYRDLKALHRQRGSAAIWFALTLPVLLGFAALAVDLARLNLIKTELQNAADAAALGGAISLNDAGAEPYNWAAASAKALEIARSNVANASQIQNADVETGYWNLQSSSWNAGSPGAGDVAAVRVTVRIDSTQNNGPVNFLFARILGIDNNNNIRARAIAVRPAVGGGTGMFPFVIKKNIFNPAWWDSTTHNPKTDPKTGKPFAIQVNLDSVYPKGGAGTWTSFTTASNSDSYVGGLIANGNVDPISIGQSIWIANGTMTNLYDPKKAIGKYVGKDIAIPVVNNLNPGSWQPVYAIAGFHLDSVTKQGNKSYMTGHFIENASFGTLNPGNGNGTQYGAYTPPILVQ